MAVSECSICGISGVTVRCPHCEGIYCDRHRRLFKHNCPSLARDMEDTNPEPGLSLSRRDITVGAFGIVAGAVGIRYASGGELPDIGQPLGNATERIDDAISTPEPADRPWDTHLGGSLFSGYSWVDEQTMRVWLPADHPTVDRLELYHEFDDEADSPVYLIRSVPEYDATMDIDFTDAFDDSLPFSDGHKEFPTASFELYGVRLFPDAGVVESFPFRLTETLAERYVS